ncbi:MAG TPA: tetratricopeptide repeat protein [Ktedonobacteraceae bacterium]|nr:tetratricopeptide repeat protein [Ktedonobacteraceae bacterium]
MPEPTEFDRTMRRIRLMIEEGQADAALAQLDAIHTDDSRKQQEITYTYAWYYTRKELWSQTVHYLSLLNDARSIEDDWNDADHTDRERRAFYLLWLGVVAVELSRYEDASQHFTQCLKVLEMRRMHLPKVRIKALYSLGLTCMMSGFYAVAIQHYEEALKVFSKEKLQDQLKKDLADIHYRLSDAYRLSGDFDHARTHGIMALHIYEDFPDRYYVGRVYNLLGRIAFQAGENQLAAEQYLASLSLATLENRAGMQLINFVAMADLRLSENSLEDAQRYCGHALEASAQLQDDHHLCGMMYLVSGKVAQEKAKQAHGQEACYLLLEALDVYKKAAEHLAQTRATSHLSELYGRRAEVHEALNQSEEALACWKSAFDVVTTARGAGWYE